MGHPNHTALRPSGRRIEEIDALRGIASIGVLLFHYLSMYRYQENMSGPLSHLFELGLYGVHLFFVISGFVILMTLRRCKTIADFLISRFSRIFPAYWTAILVTSIFLLFVLPSERPSLFQFLLNLTMLEKFFGIPHVDAVYWTLNVEMSFYCWMSIVFLLGWISKIERLIPFVLIFQGLVALYNRMSGHLFSQGIKVAFQIEYAHLFCAGMLFFLIWQDRLTPRRAILLLWCLANQGLVRFRDFDWMPSATTGVIVVGGIFTLMLFVVYGKMTWLVHPLLLFLGTISYSLYLIHNRIGGVMMDALRHAGYSSTVSVLAAVCAVFTLATLITFLIEKPAMYRIREHYKTRKKPPVFPKQEDRAQPV